MKVAIIGASGGTGRIMVRKALERGHEITAAVRNPSSLSGSYERLRVVKADVMHNQQTLEAGFSRHGEGAESYLKALGSEQGWPYILDCYAVTFDDGDATQAGPRSRARRFDRPTCYDAFRHRLEDTHASRNRALRVT